MNPNNTLIKCVGNLAVALLMAIVVAGLLNSCASLKFLTQGYTPDSAFVATAVKAELVKTGFFSTKYAFTVAGQNTVNFKLKYGWAGGTSTAGISAGNIGVGKTAINKKFRVIDQATNAETNYVAYLDKSSAKLGGIGVDWGRHERYEIFRGGSKVGQADRKGDEIMKIGFDGSNWTVRDATEMGRVSAWELHRDDKLEAILEFTQDGFFTDKYTIYADPSKKDLLPAYAQLFMMLNESVKLREQLESSTQSEGGSGSGIKIG